jgi:competence protein ComEC
MHLGILVGIIWWLCKTIGFTKPARAAICAIAVGAFLLIVPPRAPTVRAAIICWVFCASILLRRHPSPINTLSLAAIILLLVRPPQLFEAGWQLSFASVLGIVLFTERLETFMREQGLDRFSGRNTSKTGAVGLVAVKLGSLLTRLLAVGLAAWLGSAGILLYHFHALTPLACLWTVLVFPWVSAILVLGFVKMILFFLLPTLSAILGVMVILLSAILIWIVKLIAHLDISQILIGNVSLTPIILYYAVILFAGFALPRAPSIKQAVTVTGILAFVICLGVVKWQRTYRDDLVLTCLDVGHGQAILIQFPGSANVLFDAGSLHRRDIGSRIVVPYLEYAGITKIDAIVISHNDIDHINGIPEIVEHCHVERMYANDAFFDRTDEWGTAKFLSECLNEKELPIEPIPNEPDFDDSAKIRTLWPDKQVDPNQNLSDNDRSLVSLIEYAGVRILLCSDIEEFAQKELLRRYPDVGADVIIVPHHGSANTLVPEFIEKLDARILICSCDRSQYERAQSDVGLPVRTPKESRMYSTAQNGAITVSVDKKGTVTTAVFSK